MRIKTNKNVKIVIWQFFACKICKQQTIYINLNVLSQILFKIVIKAYKLLPLKENI